MANVDLVWARSDPVSIRDYAASCGFNLNAIDLRTIAKSRREWIEKEVASWIMSDLDECFEEEHGRPLSEIKKGVYVIALSGGLSINYKKKPSSVVYIGRGNIRVRVGNHLKQWITNFSESLQDAKFVFWMAPVYLGGNANLFKEVESDLLDYFYDRFGERPILNKISGESHSKFHEHSKSSYQPFRKSSSMDAGWAIRPMKDNEWFRALETDT